MPSLNVLLDARGQWPDLQQRRILGLVTKVPDSDVTIGAVPKGLASGRTAVVFRLNLPGGDRVVVVETSLRALHAATRALVAAHGEAFMREPNAGDGEKAALLIRDLVLQLSDARRRLGEPDVIDVSAADEAWDRLDQMRQALVLAKALLIGGRPFDDEAAKQIDDALVGRKPA